MSPWIAKSLSKGAVTEAAVFEYLLSRPFTLTNARVADSSKDALCCFGAISSWLQT